MYPQQGQPGQSPHPGGPQQQWSSPPPPHDHNYQPGPNGQLPPYSSAYPPRPDQHNIRPDRPEMTTVNPPYQQQPDQYRLPAPANFYQPPPMPYGNVPPQQQQQPQQNVTQSAPRQRTAIACKYCRRRKIRCSGFENSEDGRCTNCVRFSQECVFTPVSHQTQAFVPAQAVYGRGARGAPGNAPPQLYGAFGQRLPPQQQQEAYQQPPPPQQGYNLPSPNVPYPPPPQHSPYGQPYAQQQPYPQQYEPQPASAGSRRARDEPHTPTLPPPNPGPSSHMATHREPEPSGYAYPDPTGFANGAASPASSSASYQSHQQPYYAPQPPRRNSPGASTFYDHNRESSSPHGSAGYTYGQPAGAHGQTQHGRTPPPNSATSENGAKNGMSIRDIVTNSADGSGERRSAADSDMVSALDRTNRR